MPQVVVKRQPVPKQRFLKKHSRVFQGQGAYDRAYAFGRHMKAFLGLRPDDLAAASASGRKAITVQSASGTLQLDTDGTLPHDMANEVLSFVADVSAVRKAARVVPMNSLYTTVPVRTSYSRASFFRDANVGGSGLGTAHIVPGLTTDRFGGASNPVPTKLHIPLTFTAKEIADILVCEKGFAEDQTAAMGASIAEDLARALSVRENYAAWLGTGAADGTDGGITGLLNKLPAGSLKPAPAGSDSSWAVTAENAATWYAAIAALPSAIEWVVGAREPVWVSSHAFYNSVMKPVARLLGWGTERRPGEPVMWDGHEVVFNDLMARTPAADAIPLTFGFHDHVMCLGDRQTVEIVTATDADLPDGETVHNLWVRNEVGFRAIERIDVQFISRGLGTDTACGVVAGLQLPGE